MEFHEKLQALRKHRGLTQEELAAALYVSRTAISKWESGRGYPTIDSLKAISAYFSVSIDELLSGGEALVIAEEDQHRRQELAFGLLDISAGLLLFLPLFRQGAGDAMQAVSLLHMAGAPVYLQAAYFAVVVALVLIGIATLALQGCAHPLWVRSKRPLSLGLTAAGALLFIISQQPYAAVCAFLCVLMKAWLLRKTR